MEVGKGELGESVEAHLRLRWGMFYRNLANLDAFINQAQGEMDPITVSMRKSLFEAERRRKQYRDPGMLPLYDQAWAMYLVACLKHPKFAQVTSMQEELYQVYQRYLGEVQYLNKQLFSKVAFGDAYLSSGPLTGWPEAVARYYVLDKFGKDPAQFLARGPHPRRRGEMDRVRYYDGPETRELRDRVFAWTQGRKRPWARMSLPPLAIPDRIYSC